MSLSDFLNNKINFVNCVMYYKEQFNQYGFSMFITYGSRPCPSRPWPSELPPNRYLANLLRQSQEHHGERIWSRISLFPQGWEWRAETVCQFPGSMTTTRLWRKRPPECPSLDMQGF
jgi:hypothetical protein